MAKKANNRITRINEEVKHELSYILRELKDPRIPLLTSVVQTEVTTDLKHCTIYISILGDDVDHEEAVAGLKSSSGFIRKELARRLNLRNTPELHFVMDHSIEYGVRMSKLIEEVNHPGEPTKEEE